ncbi:MAG: methyl-accepting chemotaxis protein [Elusimicrobia bacterium]|nr:methyl-accepting chemotaxis protein [Elusimicrobiota bacterium]
MILKWALLVFIATLATYLVTIGFVVHQDKTSQGTYFFVKDIMGSDPIAVKRHQIAIPTLLLAGAVGFLITCLAGIIYSHRLAGPIYHFKRVIEETLQGKKPETIILRKNDEFKDLAEVLNQLLQKFHH